MKLKDDDDDGLVNLVEGDEKIVFQRENGDKVLVQF